VSAGSSSSSSWANRFQVLSSLLGVGSDMISLLGLRWVLDASLQRVAGWLHPPSNLDSIAVARCAALR
jgi:hypothetical protein